MTSQGGSSSTALRQNRAGSIALICSEPSHAALLEHIATYCTVGSFVHSVSCLTKHTRKVLSRSAPGTDLIQRFWYMQHHYLVWQDEKTDLKKAALLFSMTKDNAKKVWRQKFMSEYEAHLQRTLRGHGRSNNCAKSALSPSAPASPNASNPVGDDFSSAATKCKTDGALEANEGELQRRDDAVFIDACRTGGIEVYSHFLGHNAGKDCTASNVARSEYKQDPRLGKRKEKHAKGAARAWSAWDQEGNYDY